MVLFVSSIALFLGCMVAPVVPPSGGVYNNITAPLDVDVESTKMYSKRGESSSISILSLVAVGDAGIAAAAKNGGITIVEHADYNYFNILGIYQKYTTIVYGQ